MGVATLALVLAKSAPLRAESLSLPLRALETPGRRVLAGQRLEVWQDGQVLLARQLFPVQGKLSTSPLPKSMGGGWLFCWSGAEEGSLGSRLFRSSSFTGPLEELGRLPFLVESLSAAWGRVYLQTPSGLRALQWEPLRASDLGRLPALPAYQDLRFDQGEHARFRTILLGDWESQDGGRSFAPARPRPAEVPAPEEAWLRGPKALGLTTAAQGAALGRAASGEPGSAVSGSGFRLFRVSELRTLLERGVPVRPGLVVLETRDARWELELLGASPKPGAAGARKEAFHLVFRRRGSSLTAAEDCQGVSSESPLMLCRKDEGASLYRVGEQGVQLLAQVPNHGLLLARSSAAVLLEGSCDGQAGGLCSLSSQGAHSWPRPMEAWALGLQGVQPFSLSLGKDLQLKQGGRLVQGFTATELLRDWAQKGASLLAPSWDGQVLSAWLLWGEELHRLRSRGQQLDLELHGPSLRHSLFFGPWALVDQGGGSLLEGQVDGTWEERSQPFQSGDSESSSGNRQDLILGCSAVACSLGERVRLGWGPEGTEPLLFKETSYLPFPPPGGARYQLECEWKMSGAPLPRTEGSASVPVGSLGRLEYGALRSGRELRAEALRLSYPSFLGEPRWLSSRATEGLWAHRAEAEEAMGLLEPATSRVDFFPEARGEGGLLLLRGQARELLLRAAPNQELLPLASSQAPGLGGAEAEPSVLNRGRFLSWAWAQGRAWLLVSEGETLRLYEVSEQEFRLFAEYPVRAGEVDSILLAVNEREELALWTEAEQGQYLYPLGPRGELSLPKFYAHLGHHPPACQGEQGYQLVRSLSLVPKLKLHAQELDLYWFQARLRYSARGVCLEGMRARASALTQAQTWSRAPAPAPEANPSSFQHYRPAIPVSLELGEGSQAHLELLSCE